LLARPADREVVLARIEREPYATLLAEIVSRAEREYEEDEDPAHWDPHANGRNGTVAMCNAFLAWLFDDAAAAEKARDFFARLETDWYTNEVFDCHIRMPEPLMGYTNAWDLLMATDFFPAAEAQAAQEKITEICKQFYDTFVEDEAHRDIMLGLTQNNYPIRTAAAIGYVALAFPDHPDASAWADWSFSELTHLWGPKGCYVQPDGGVSEGPSYAEFSFAPSVALFIAHYNLFDAEGNTQTYIRDCRNRVSFEPFDEHGCVPQEPFSFENPLLGGLFHEAAEWALAIRLPWGSRPPLGDAYFSAFNGSALLTAFGGAAYFGWDWRQNRDQPLATTRGSFLTPHHLIFYDDNIADSETPQWTTRFMPDAGNAVFRSDWSHDAIWGLLVAEHGAARKTIHDHVDGTSFSLAAYGEYLLIDPGYYKPDQTKNAKTCNSDAHNILLVDGRGAPDKGLLTAFRDADAFLENTLSGPFLEYAEAHQNYEDGHETRIERSVAFVDGRYFVICDWLETAATAPRPHTFRLNGYAGYGSGGEFLLRPDGARWQRSRAGLEAYVSATATPLAVVEPPFAEHEVPHVQKFALDRAVTHHAVMDATVLATRPAFLSVLAPYATDPQASPRTQPPAVERLTLLPPETGLGWQITVAGNGGGGGGDDDAGVDYALLRTADAPTALTLPGAVEVATDARFIVFRLTANGTPIFALIARGTVLTVNGQSLITDADPAAAVSWENP
jgi:hypothetical protein